MLDEFFKKREEEKAWLNMNGYENCDSNTNGEFRTVLELKDLCNLFIDVGSNSGEFIEKFILADNPYIIAFEPNPVFKDILNKKIIGKGQVITKAVSNQSGVMKFYIHSKYPETASLNERIEMMPTFRRDMEVYDVDVIILDDYLQLIKNIANKGLFLKIDVEGSELKVIKGAEDILSSIDNVILLFEYSYAWKESDCKLKEAFHFLDELGYQLYRITPFGLEWVRFFTLDIDNFLYCNYIAIKGINLNSMTGNKRKLATKQGYTDFYCFNNIIK